MCGDFAKITHVFGFGIRIEPEFKTKSILKRKHHASIKNDPWKGFSRKLFVDELRGEHFILPSYLW